MYSLVLMATLATPATVPDCHFRSCYGRSCHGCYGTCYGARYGCSGCSGCYGSCSGCYGTAYYYSCSCSGGHSCYGCSGCTGCHGAAYTPGFVPAPAPAAPAPAPTEKKTTSLSPARVIVSLPADARLIVDGQATATKEKAVRTFLTPELEEGVEYRYVMKAEVVRDGQTLTETQTVLVKAGLEVRAEFATLGEMRTASNR
jgi:uncharacterized protein (TIGR03000 family)